MYDFTVCTEGDIYILYINGEFYDRSDLQELYNGIDDFCEENELCEEDYEINLFI